VSGTNIPNSWRACRFDAVARVVSGRNQREVENPAGEYPIYGSGGCFGRSTSYLCEAGTTVIGRKGTINSPIFVNERFWNVDTAFGLCAIDGDVLIPRLLYYFCRSFNFASLDKSTTIPSLAKRDIEAITILLPPLAEQKRIVSRIEELFSELEAGEESLRVARRQLGVYRQSLLKQAFVGKLTAQWRTQNPDGATSPWRNVELSEVLTSKPTNGRSVKDRAGGFKVLRLTAIQNGAIDLRENKEGDWSAADAAAHIVRKGNFLVSRGNGSLRLVGRGGIVREDAEIAFPDTMIRLPLDLRLVEPLYFSYVWNSDRFRRQIEASARTTAGIYKINQSLLIRYYVPMCSLPEQQEIVRLLDQQFEVIEQNEREIDAALKRSEALRQSILKEAFTGRLVPQNPSDEPASQLLARLRAERFPHKL
jgi:type I restriction enzyme, S subunit